MLEVQARSVREMERIRKARENDTVAVFTHGDVIRLLIAHYCGIPNDLFQRILVSPGSISIVELQEQYVQVRCVNRTVMPGQ
jgi:broad specificity phosphatase PhoE